MQKISIIGADAFGVLLDAVRACVEAGDSAETSAPAAAVRVWVSLHGMATLRASLPWFPWPPRDALLDDLVRRAADLRPPPPGQETTAADRVSPSRSD